MLAFAGVGHRYGARVALDYVDLEIARGECVALVGPSGAGKSTLFRLAYGAFAPTSGRVMIDGVDLAAQHGVRLRAARAKIAVIFQAHGLVDSLSVGQNVIAGTFGRRTTWDSLRAMIAPTAAERARVAEVLERLGLGDRARDRAFDLSGGQRQRVAIARTIVQSAPLVLADEPAASLDPELARQIVEILLFDARARGATLVCTLHQPELTAAFDRVVTLSRGRVAVSAASARSTS